MRQTALTTFDWQYVANNSPARPQIILIYRLRSVMDVSLTEFEREGKHSSYRGRCFDVAIVLSSFRYLCVNFASSKTFAIFATYICQQSAKVTSIMSDHIDQHSTSFKSMFFTKLRAFE